MLSGLSGDRRFERVREVLLGLSERVGTLTEAQEKYVLSEDFEDLLTETLQRVWRERNEEKRSVYRDFLADAIKSPGEPYDEQLRFLRSMEELQGDHIRILKAMRQEPDEQSTVFAGSRFHTLKGRLADVPDGRLRDLVTQLADMRILSSTLEGMVTGRSAEDLRPMIAPYGQRLVRFIEEGSSK